MSATGEGAPHIPQQPASSDAVPLSEAYRRAIEQTESLAENRSGADKTWVERALQEYRAHYSRSSRAQ